MVGDKATNIVAKPSILVTEVTMVPADVTANPSAIPASQVEVVVEETNVSEADAGTLSVQPNLPAIDAVEISEESPSHDSQHVMEGEAETWEVHPISPIRNLVCGGP